MRAAAELKTVSAHIHHTDHIPVLFAKQGGSMGLLCLFQGHLLCHDRIVSQNRLVHGHPHGIQLFFRRGGEVGKVKTQEVGIHQRARLMHMLAQHIAEGAVQQMGRAVRAAEGHAALGITRHSNTVAYRSRTAEHDTVVHEFAALVFLYAADLEKETVLRDGSRVGQLSAHLGIQHTAVKDQNGLCTFRCKFAGLVAADNGEDLCLTGIEIITEKFRLGDVLSEADAGPAQIAQCLTGLAGTQTLLLHQGAEAVFIHGVSGVLAHLLRQVGREAVGIIQFEGIRAGEHRLGLGPMRLHELGENTQPGIDGGAELLFLAADNGCDIGLLLAEFRILAFADAHDRLDDLVQEGPIHAQQPAVARSAAQQAAQHVAAAFIGGQHTVTDHEDGAADMVRDHAQRHVLFMAFSVVGTGQLADPVRHMHDRVDVKE